MKNQFVQRGSEKQSTKATVRLAVDGGNGISVAPPNYGIGFVDQAPTRMAAQHAALFQPDDAESDRSSRHGKAAPFVETLQMKAGSAPAQSRIDRLPATNDTGLPDSLKSGIESLSGVSLDGVSVHYNSSEPSRLNALAYTQGRNIYLAPGQERHLPHEAWHVVQQTQGRVRPTTQMKDRVSINDDKGLEHEADAMGARALSAAHQVMPVEKLNDGGASQVGSGDTIQRMNLEQTGWITSLVPDRAKRSVVGDGRQVNIYMDPMSIKVGNRLEALQKLATRNAFIGKKVDEKAEEVWGIGDSNEKWTKKSSPLNQKGLQSVDPFFYEGLAKWGSNENGYGEEFVGFLFQHAAAYTGYVEAILDTSNPGAQGVPTMYDAYNEPGLRGTVTADRNLKFSNIHAAEGGIARTNLLALSERGGEEQHLDAYTKIAGEGARWQCVRNHASKLTNTSRFFTIGYTKGKAWTVTFKSLWLGWRDYFDKKYDISDRTVADKLKSTNLGKEVLVSQLDAGDYDLDSSRSFALPFNCFPAGAKAKDYYYTQAKHPRQVLYVSWGALWDNWYTVFGGQYGITNQQVADAVWDGRLQSNWAWKDKINNSYYNLD
jgi:Domain of unknown function (DUF4157)